MASWSGGPEAGPRLEDLERLAAELGSERYAVTLVTSAGRRPCLRVTNRAAKQLTEDIYAGDGRFWWGWAEPIGPVWNTAAAAEAVRRVLAANAVHGGGL